MNETEILGTLSKGASGADVQKAQEWLTLSGFGVVIDGQFGPATELAVEQYQSSQGLPQDGTVTPALFDRLVAPMSVRTRGAGSTGAGCRATLSASRDGVRQ